MSIGSKKSKFISPSLECLSQALLKNAESHLPFEKYFLSHRGLVETVIEQLKALCQIEHTRHRNPLNFLVNTLSGLIAYILRPRKPKLNWSNFPKSFLLIPS